MSTPRRGRKSISENVWLLQNTLAKILNDNDRTFLIHSLNQYQKDRDILELVTSLKRVLDSPKKREVYPLLRDIIPSNDKRYFERAWHTNQPKHVTPNGSWNNSTSTRSRSRSQNRPQEHLRRSNFYSSLPENLDKSDSGVEFPALKKSSSSRSFQKYPIRRLYLKRAPGTGYGFSMRGGSEHGVGLYVSSLDDNSIAEYEGLLPGDHIISVNDIQFDGLSHDQAVKIIKNSKKLNMVVRSVGRIPNTFVAESTYKWIDSMGQRVSPPPNVDSNGREMSIDGIHRSDLRLLGDDDERKVNVFIEEGDKLGLRIRGGSEYGLGIYIAGVDPNSAAEKAGLKCGDQIMDVNGISFLNITHADAVKVLKSDKNMMVTMKDVGRLPFAKTVTDRTRWTKGKLSGKPVQRRHTTAGRPRLVTERSEKSKFSHGIAGSQLLYNGSGPSAKSLAEDQARLILNENELGTMTYYMEEYSKGFISVDAFVLALFSLFNTPDKVSLLSEVRGFIHPRDIDRFDDLVLKREIEAIRKRKVTSPQHREDAHSIRSYSSSVSSYSEHGSSSSWSSAKESLDSRPITPPRVPEVLPDNMKLLKHRHGKKEKEGLLSFMSNDDTLNDSRDSIPSPPSDFTTVFPLSASSPRKPKHNAVTNGEITKNLVIGDNDRVKYAPHKKQDSKKSHKQHSEKQEKSFKEGADNTASEKEHNLKTKNDFQSSSDHSFELISETKKEKRGFFINFNKGSYSPYKHDQSLASKESTNLYHVSVVKKKDEQDEAGTSVERSSVGEAGEKLGNHDFEKAHSSIPLDTTPTGFVSGEKVKHSHSENSEEKYDESTFVVDEDDYALPSTLMNGYRTSPKKVDDSKHSSSAVEKQPLNPKAPFKPKPYHAKTEDQTKEGNNGNISFEGKQTLKSSSQSPANSAFAPPKPKPYISQPADRTAKDSYEYDDDKRKDTHGDHEIKSFDASPGPKHYDSLELFQAPKESRDSDQQDSGHQQVDYVDIDSIKRAKQLSRQNKKPLEKNINGDKKRHEYVDPKVMDFAVNNPPPIPNPYSSKVENNTTLRKDPDTPYTGPPDASETNFYSGSHATSPVSDNPPTSPKPYSPKSRNIVSEKNDFNTKFRRHTESTETRLESTPHSSSPIKASNGPTPIKKVMDKNNNPQESGKFSNGNNVGTVVSCKPEVHDLTSNYHDQVYDGMYLAMEESATTRSGLEKSTSWGDEIMPSGSFYDTLYDTQPSIEGGRLDSVKSIQKDNLVMNSNPPKMEGNAVVSNHDDEVMVKKDMATLPVEGCVTTERSSRSHASPNLQGMTSQGVKAARYIGSRQENDKRTETVNGIRIQSKQGTVTTPESVTKDWDQTLDHKETTIKYDINQNIEEAPKNQSVQNMILAYNRMSNTSDAGNSLSRRGSTTNRKSWDGVGKPSEKGQDQKTSMVEGKKGLKSNSDSNLINLPKEQQKSIQVKLRASQELLELRQQSRDSSTNNSRRSSVDLTLTTEPPSLTVSPSAKPMHSQHGEAYDVEIAKTSEGLGLTLEGGSDTSPRNAPVKVKLVKEGPYAAYACGKLRPGQTVLQINDTSIQGMTNAMAILTLRQAYTDPETKTLILVVKDP
ncbi:uncharacterized protein LOC116297698 isoform X2 [Actinia tenebrosa]|uniref:Uncharacterized protein LOC116297698 isoform X2 n=1 Tax=Actinia tenebrosa TaxID=6105 RepID=A0A6P8I9M3_ACTTE|nr:uncharacterized protein LOC116297698 isoform X2 [Actinia tenebrosa]